MELWDLRVTVESIEGRSVCGLAVGDYFELTHSSQLTIPAGRHFCVYALASVLPRWRPSSGRSTMTTGSSPGDIGVLPRPGRTAGHEDRTAPAVSLDPTALT